MTKGQNAGNGPIAVECRER